MFLLPTLHALQRIRRHDPRLVHRTFADFFLFRVKAYVGLAYLHIAARVPDVDPITALLLS